MQKHFFYCLLVLFMTNCTYSFAQTVKGKLSYPSEYVPSLIVYLKNTATGELFKYVSKEGEMKYEFKNIPAGKYVAYCYLNDSDSDFGAGYTKAVPCGLSVECNDHSLIQFEVKEKGITDKINIGDWYGAEIPPKS